MRGPADTSVGPSGTVQETEEQLAPVPGGKVLLRLLQQLESEGLGAIAAEAVRAAVPDEDVSQVFETAQAMGIPTDTAQQSASEVSPRGRRAGRSRGSRPAEGEPDQASSSEEVAAVYAQAAHAPGPPTAVGPQWRSIGPWTVTNGQTYGSSRVNVSGRVSALATDPHNPAHVLAGAANGGVWESFDRGASWSSRTDYQATLTVGALAFDPTTPGVVYCGLGEGDWWSWLGTGVLRSSDGGTTWSPLATAPFVGQGFYSLVVDPADGQRLYAGTTGGLYVSTNGGTTWTQRRAARTWTISIRPTGGQIMAGCSDGVYRSTNNGTTWIAATLPGAPTAWDRLAVAIAPSSPTIAYAWGARAGVPYLYRRSGGNWTQVPSPPGVATGQAWYDWYVAVAPDRDTQVYCGAIEIHRGDLAGATWTWRNLSNKGTSGDSIHPDQHSIAFEPGRPDTVYAGNDGGVFRSDDRGITWTHCNNGLQVSEFEYITQDWGAVRWLLGGTQDNGTNRWLGPLTWEHVQDGDGGDCSTNRANPQTVFHTFQNGWLERSTTKGGWGSWANITPARPAGEAAGLFYVPLESSATNGDTLGIGGLALYVSRNNGTTWTRLPYPGAGGTASALYAPDANTVLVGLTDGRIFRTTWTGAWTALTALTTPRAGAWISDLHAETGGTGRIWCTSTRVGGGRVFRSDDGGVTWTDRSAGLPALPINAIAVDDANRDRVWVAADLGVYQSTNGGASWSDFSASLPNAFVGDLLFHPHARVLRAGLRNRGVWEIPVDGWMTQPSCGVQWIGSLAANETRRWFTWGWPASWYMVWTVMPTTPAPGAPQVSWTVQVERADAERATHWITVRNLTGQPVQFEGRFAILSRY
jgi:hypothetical protein